MKSQQNKGEFHRVYASRFGVLAGYLPQNRDKLDAWLKSLAKTVKKEAAELSPKYIRSVQDLDNLINNNGIVRMYVTEMIDQVPPEHKTVDDIPDLLNQLNYIVTHAPEYNEAHQGFFPMSSLFVYMMYTPAGEAAFRNEDFNSAVRVILQQWCDFLDSASSLYVLNTGPNGWLSPSAYAYNKLDEFVIPDKNAPHWGFTSFNDYFHREVKAKLRPISDPNNNKVVVSANDGTTWKLQRNVKLQDTFWIKSQPYSLLDMLDNSALASEFEQGDVFQSFLSGADYHRWHAPVGGKVVEARIVNGLMFSELHALGFDSSAGTNSQGYETAVNTRGLIIIDTEDETLGKVAVIPVGITEISSVSIFVKPGDRVSKGQEIGWFSYGGSSMALVFCKGAIATFLFPDPEKKPVPIQVNAAIAEVNN